MAKLQWDQPGEKLYETGISQGVLYPQDSTGAYPMGYAWNGLISVEESPSGAEATDLYADNNKYLSLISAEQYSATITAYTYPDQFEECDGTKSIADTAIAAGAVTVGQQTRKSFGLVYVTKVGNDLTEDYGEKIHIIYGCKASPSSKSHQTINESPEAIEFSWEISTTPVNPKTITGCKALSTITIDTAKFPEAKAAKLQLVKDTLFGTDPNPSDPQSEGTDPTLPDPDSLMALLNATMFAE